MLDRCPVSPQPSAIPGNIGTLNSEVVIWDHDPFWGRPTQILSWPFSKTTGEQRKETEEELIFELGGAILKPVYRLHDMFICTVNPELEKDQDKGGFDPDSDGSPVPSKGVDFLGSPASGVGLIAQPKLPGGDIFKKCAERVEGPPAPGDPFCDGTTGANIFHHQVWRHIGSLLDPLVVVHPSEYLKELSEIQNKDIENVEVRFHSAPRFDYKEITEDGRSYIMPYQTTKHSSGQTTHWTLEKWTPLWQGEDFSIKINLDKNTNDAIDPKDGVQIDTPIEPYKYLLYDMSSDPPRGFVPGISNQAFHVFPQRDKEGNLVDNAIADATAAGRNAFDWRYKTYILIEMGVNNNEHRYFIELVKGRKPRFLHLGDEWDHPERLDPGAIIDESSDDGGFKFMRKCRELSVFQGLSTNELFKQKDFRVTVRSHLGRIVITFEGREDNPWVINRRDNDPSSVSFDKILIPMVVPSAPMRIHGGNISCGINFTPLEFIPTGSIKFVNRQVDTKQADDKDIYITFSHMGNSLKHDNARVAKEFFNDKRFAYYRGGYDCDAYEVTDIIRNKAVDIPIYELYKKQYIIHGKGWILDRPRTEKIWIVAKDKDTQSSLPAKSKNGMEDSPSRIHFINARDPGSKFPLTLDEETDDTYPYTDFAAKWDITIQLSAGTMRINPPTGSASPIAGKTGIAIFENSVTPIATSWRLIVLGGGKPFGSKFPGDAWSKGSPNAEPFDISPLVQKINDSWSSEDFFSIKHEMQMECYIPIESTSSDDPIEATPAEANLFGLGRKLLALHNKSFYPTVSYWWDTGIGHRGVIGNKLNDPNIGPIDNDMLIQMTGVAYGATLHRSNNQLIMKFTINDYMSVMEKQFIFNSPFFDGVQDVQAIYELSKLAGFDDSPGKPTGIDRRPLGYLRKVLDDGDLIEERKFFFNGEESRCERYDLPGSYVTLAEPSVKFQNGETYESAMKRIAQLSGKAIYFDRWGVLRLETLPSISAAFSLAKRNDVSSDANRSDQMVFTPVFDFVSTPIARSSNIPDPDSNKSKFVFNPEFHAAHLVYNTLTYQRSVEDCVNQIVLMSATSDQKLSDGRVTGGFVIEGYTFFDQIWDPESEGFIGYRKPFYQSNGIFGGTEGLRQGIAQYAKMKHPPVIMTFEAYGVPGLKALDIISLDGNLAYITEISHELDATSNRWWMNLTTEWLKSFTGELGFLEATEETTIPGT